MFVSLCVDFFFLLVGLCVECRLLDFRLWSLCYLLSLNYVVCNMYLDLILCYALLFYQIMSEMRSFFFYFK